MTAVRARGALKKALWAHGQTLSLDLSRLGTAGDALAQVQLIPSRQKHCAGRNKSRTITSVA